MNMHKILKNLLFCKKNIDYVKEIYWLSVDFDGFLWFLQKYIFIL